MITEVLLWDADNQTLVSGFFDKDTMSNNLTLRSPAIPSYDYNDDGYIDIPVNLKNLNSDELNGLASDSDPVGHRNDKRIHMTQWMNFKGNRLVVSQNAFINASKEFWFNIPENLSNSLMAYKTESGVMTVYKTRDGVNRDEPLFSFVVKKKSQMTEEDTFTFKAENDDRIVFGTLTSAGEEMGFTNEKISENIVFFTEGV